MALTGQKPPMVKPRNSDLRGKLKNLTFDEALKRLKRKHMIARAQWNGNFFLELRSDAKGNKEIFSSSGKEGSTGIRHTFDQNEILASDWLVL